MVDCRRKPIEDDSRMHDRAAYRELEPLNAPRPLAEDAADVIRDRILDGRFPHGEHLVEATLAKQLAS
jgi:DNA-binding GntR family transcriptional regulator